MSKVKFDINEILLAAHKRGQEKAIDDSIRSGVPLVVSINGKIVSVKPKFKYVRVPIESNMEKNHPHSKS